MDAIIDNGKTNIYPLQLTDEVIYAMNVVGIHISC